MNHLEYDHQVAQRGKCGFTFMQAQAPKYYHFNLSLFEDDCLLHSFVLALVTSKYSGRNRMHTPLLQGVFRRIHQYYSNISGTFSTHFDLGKTPAFTIAGRKPQLI